MNYTSWHNKLRRLKGKPGTCVGCGGQAMDWALKAEHHVPGQKLHVEDLDAYEARCRACHVEQDHDGFEVKPETRINWSAAQQKRFQDPNQRAQLDSARLLANNEASREKKRKAMRWYYADPANREKTSAAQKKRFEDPEERKKVGRRAS